MTLHVLNDVAYDANQQKIENYVIMTVPRWCFFCGSFLSCFAMLFVDDLRSPAGKELTS